jgi:hypothetical protein
MLEGVVDYSREVTGGEQIWKTNNVFYIDGTQWNSTCNLSLSLSLSLCPGLHTIAICTYVQKQKQTYAEPTHKESILPQTAAHVKHFLNS